MAHGLLRRARRSRRSARPTARPACAARRRRARRRRRSRAAPRSARRGIPTLVGEVGRALGREARSKSAHVAAGADRQPPPHAARRPQLRVLQRGPGAHGGDRRRLHPRRAARGRRRLRQALRRQRHRVRAHDDLVARSTSARCASCTSCRSRRPSRRPACASIMTAYNRLNGTYCGEHPWLITDVLRGEWGFDGVVDQRLVRHPQRRRVAARRARPRDARAAAPPRARTCAAPSTPARSASASWTRPWPGCWRSATWTGAATTGTDEETADDADTRPSSGAPAARAMVLLKDDGDVLPLAADDAARRADRAVRPLRPAAGWRQRPGAPRPRPGSVRRPRRAWLRRDVRARRLDRASTCRRCAATSRVAVRRRVRRTATIAAGRLAWYWDQPPVAGIDVHRVLGPHRRARSSPTRPGSGRSACGPSGPSPCCSTASRWSRSRRAHAAGRSSAWAAPRSAARSRSRKAGRTSWRRLPGRGTRRAGARPRRRRPAVPTGDHIERAVAVAAGAESPS